MERQEAPRWNLLWLAEAFLWGTADSSGLWCMDTRIEQFSERVVEGPVSGQWRGVHTSARGEARATHEVTG